MNLMDIGNALLRSVNRSRGEYLKENPDPPLYLLIDAGTWLVLRDYLDGMSALSFKVPGRVLLFGMEVVIVPQPEYLAVVGDSHTESTRAPRGSLIGPAANSPAPPPAPEG